MENHDQKLQDEIVGYAARDVSKALDTALVDIANAMIMPDDDCISIVGDASDAVRSMIHEALYQAECRIIRELRGVGDEAIPAVGRRIKEQREEQH